MNTASNKISSSRDITNSDILNGRGQLGETIYITVNSLLVLLTPGSIPGIARYCHTYVLDITDFDAASTLVLPAVGTDVAVGFRLRVSLNFTANVVPSPNTLLTVVRAGTGGPVQAFIAPGFMVEFVALENLEWDANYFMPGLDVAALPSQAFTNSVIAYSDGNYPIIAGPLDTGKITVQPSGLSPITAIPQILVFPIAGIKSDVNTYDVDNIGNPPDIVVLRNAVYKLEAQVIVDLALSAPIDDIEVNFFNGTLMTKIPGSRSVTAISSELACIEASAIIQLAANTIINIQATRTSIVGTVTVNPTLSWAYLEFITRPSGVPFM